MSDLPIYNPLIAGIIGMATVMNASMKSNYENKKTEIQEEWERSKNYPRKKKKKVRKGLLLSWSINEWGKDFMF